MQDVQNQLDRMAGHFKSDSKEPSPEWPVDFGLLASRWAEYCCKHHLGSMLIKGLAISAALVEYDAELKGEVPK